MKIAISGKIGSGKSTLAEHLCEAHGFDIFAFAYNLKLDVINMGVPAWVMTKKPTPPWLRKLLQLYGADKRSGVNPAYWIARLFDDIEAIDPDNHVIEDMRYWNEARWARSNGYKMVKIVKLGDKAGDTHPSETDLDEWHDWDLVIEVGPGELEDMFDIIDDELEVWVASNRSESNEGDAGQAELG